MFPDGEKGNGAMPDAFSGMGLASRLPGDAGTVSKLLRLLRSLPSTPTYSVSIPSADEISALLNTAFWASLQEAEGQGARRFRRTSRNEVPLVRPRPSDRHEGGREQLYHRARRRQIQARAPARRQGRLERERRERCERLGRNTANRHSHLILRRDELERKDRR